MLSPFISIVLAVKGERSYFVSLCDDCKCTGYDEAVCDSMLGI